MRDHAKQGFGIVGLADHFEHPGSPDGDAHANPEQWLRICHDDAPTSHCHPPIAPALTRAHPHAHGCDYCSRERRRRANATIIRSRRQVT